ncbi:ABC transporter ATP-binding protein [Thalassobaculum sp. OXR-137]|uniref:ABC transporter ATP-binding protein n=1 Tax=Thalassobaculum sp. OXR-137 TaxID=3100173 RepID=UPI002AC8E45E|nr:ABC transporter ATP-binding protein [Thalassobaculum sp. OXR-137]WPZ32488.1 ABC transporter ATP-binding protein [Thalassobaculum sp. OXR-137]
MADPILELAGLRKSYGALTVTDGVNLAVKAGAIHAVIGPNGAGKTTLINQIGGQVVPDAGTVILDGRNITDLPIDARSHLGLARSFQITNVLPGFTTLDNVAVAAQAHAGHSFRFFRPVARETALTERAMACLETVGLADRAPIRAGALSHGEKRALEIAMALATDPKVLLLDEPMAGTTHEETARLTETLEGLRGRFTILLVEHDMAAVFALADTISVLVYGRVIAEGTPDAIRADPEVRAAYLGEEEIL